MIQAVLGAEGSEVRGCGRGEVLRLILSFEGSEAWMMVLET